MDKTTLAKIAADHAKKELAADGFEVQSLGLSDEAGYLAATDQENRNLRIVAIVAIGEDDPAPNFEALRPASERAALEWLVGHTEVGDLKVELDLAVARATEVAGTKCCAVTYTRNAFGLVH